MRYRSYDNIFRFERAKGLYNDGLPILPWIDSGECVIYKVYYVEDAKSCMRALIKHLKKKSHRLLYYTKATFEDTLENLLFHADNVLDHIKDVPKKAPLPMTYCEVLSCICRYCHHQYKSVYSCDRHMISCKVQDDPLKQLEIDLNIDIPPPPKNTCAYCYKKLVNKKLLNMHLKGCTSKRLYHHMLQQQKNSSR